MSDSTTAAGAAFIPSLIRLGSRSTAGPSWNLRIRPSGLTLVPWRPIHGPRSAEASAEIEPTSNTTCIKAKTGNDATSWTYETHFDRRLGSAM